MNETPKPVGSNTDKSDFSDVDSYAANEVLVLAAGVLRNKIEQGETDPNVATQLEHIEAQVAGHQQAAAPGDMTNDLPALPRAA